MALAQLSIDIVAKLAAFQRDMDRAAAETRGFREQVTKELEGLKSGAATFAAGLAASMGAAFSVGAITDWIGRTTEAADELTRLSQQTGVSVEALSAWGNVAKRNGQDVNDLSELIQELSLKLTETDTGAEGAGLALKQLGLSYKDLGKLGAEEAFLKVSQAVAGVEDSGKKTAMVMAILGDEGQKYVSTLNQIGSAAELEATITAQQAEQATRYRDSLATLGAAGEAWSQSVVSGIIPALDEAARALTDVIAGTGGMTSEARRLAGDGSLTDWARGGVTALTYLMDAGALVTRSLKSIGLVIGGMLANAGAGISAVGEAAKRAAAGDFGGALDALKGYQAQVKSIDADLSADLSSTWGQTLGSQIRDRIDQIKTAGTEATKATDAAKKSSGGFSLVKADDSEAKKAAEAAKKAQEEYEKLLTTIRTKTAADEAEAQGLAPLTEAQRYALEVMTQVRDGRLKLSDQQKLTVAQYLEEAAAAEAASIAAKKQAEWLQASADESAQSQDAAAARTAQLRETLEAERLQTTEAGLSAEALATLRQARELDKAAALESRVEAMAGLESHAALSAEWRAQAEAIRAIVAAQRDRAAEEQRQRESPAIGMQRALDKIRGELSDTASATEQAFGNIASGIEGALTGAFSGSADGAKQLFATIKAEAMKMLVIRPIMQQIFGGSSGGGGGNLLGSLVGAIGATFGGVGGNAGYGDYSGYGYYSEADLRATFGRATGGSVSAGSMYEVNERGPELLSTGGRDYLMMGGEGGYVTPITPGAASGGGGPVTITYAPQITIDSRADRGAIMSDVAALNQRSQGEMMQMLRNKGVL